MTSPIKAYSTSQLQTLVKEAGLPAFRAKQILEWLYAKGVSSYEDMTNMPKAMREQFAETYPLYTPVVADKQVSVDGSRKYLLHFYDDIVVETVALPANDGRFTVCCSSQAGCAMGCSFCATGRNGLSRSLAVGEIIDQILMVQRDFGERVTNVVVMGQGEPFANYDNVLAALRIMNDPKLLNIGARHITVSTCGIIEGIGKFAEEPEQFTLAISLHAARQDVRDEIMPSMKSQRLGALRQALEHYSSATGRRFSFEYALMKGVNDSEEDLQALITYCRRLLCHVNLIPLNEIDDSPIHPVSNNTMHYWRDELENAGIPASIRTSRGADIAGACGQLANKHTV
ncbi:MAG: 23S rRNA (adenine(2503)-C(2))-methyltransferase RlmN [Eggerthellaceae bacterium]|nr:23S rRNA (adenine(2503)-C(2))-methyltransferase RlmN [Eggerthellaceae bacterium]